MPDESYSDTRVSPVHFRPGVGRLADTIPFYWNGEYHIFYLLSQEHVTWEHIVSRDLIRWRELPTALRADGAADGPDGGHMFTGSVIERNGLFHIFYTGHNPANPQGLEFVMHATSDDLIRWKKHPDDILAPDGIFYKNDDPRRDFRDPYVFWNEDESLYWMVFLADDPATGKMVQGLAVSSDLIKWEFQEALDAPIGQECPDVFKIGDLWYLIGGDKCLWARNSRGPYELTPEEVIDRPGVYAGKRMFDGRRHIWTGWLWDRVPETDAGEPQWGGTQCLPRELYGAPGGHLYCKPVDEVFAAFQRTVFDLRGRPIPRRQTIRWYDSGSSLVGECPKGGSQCSFEAPDDYMLECTARLDGPAVFTISLRETSEPGYTLTLDAGRGVVTLGCRDFVFERPIDPDWKADIPIRIFVQGSMIETFIANKYALSCRAYDHPEGGLGLSIAGGRTLIGGLRAKSL